MECRKNGMMDDGRRTRDEGLESSLRSWISRKYVIAYLSQVIKEHGIHGKTEGDAFST